MKQYKITSQDILPKSDNDCYLDPNDPIHDLVSAGSMGELGGAELLNKYRISQLPTINVSNKGQIQKERNIKPGTPEWFQLWFGGDS